MGAKLVEWVLLTWAIIGSIITANFITMNLFASEWFMRIFMKKYTAAMIVAMEEITPKD